METTSHVMDRISRTADLNAARRRDADIPFARDIFAALLDRIGGAEEAGDLFKVFDENNASLVPLFESMYRILDKLIAETGVKRILEVGAGLSSRGLVWTDDPACRYVELDLPNKSREKREIVSTVMGWHGIGGRDNLRIEGGDACDGDDFARALSRLGGEGPVVVAHEGLLRYLSHEEKGALAGHVRRALGEHGGFWITPDVHIIHPMMRRVALEDCDDRTRSKLAMDFSENLFESVSDARVFFEDHGFAVEERSYREVFHLLVSPRKLGIPMAKVERLVGEKVAFVMKLCSG